MLIKFSSNAAGGFSMFGDDAMALIRFMTGTAQHEGALHGQAISDSLRRLQAGVKARKPSETVAPDDPDDDENEERVRVSARATPLLEMLEKAAAEVRAGDPETYVMWQPE